MDRDILMGLEKRISSDYTITYFEIFNSGNFQCVSMPLMKCSLQKELTPLMKNSKKTYLSDEVLILYYKLNKFN
jgi:hypothetical protein